MIVFRWLARISGLLIFCFLSLFMIGEGIDFREMIPAERMIGCSLLLAMLGMLILWKWEGTGGLMILVGMTSFYLLSFLLFASFPSGWGLATCFVPGVLAILSWAFTIDDPHDQSQKKTMVKSNRVSDHGSHRLPS